VWVSAHALHGQGANTVSTAAVIAHDLHKALQATGSDLAKLRERLP